MTKNKIDNQTLFIECPTCRSDVAETLGVTGYSDGAPESAVVMQCDVCSTVYLAPSPVKSEDSSDAGSYRVYARSIEDLQRHIPAGASFIAADPDGKTIAERGGDKESFDLIHLPLTLEGSEDPVALLRQVGELVKTGGTVAVLGANVNSSCFRVFGGRHWFGYRFPNVRQVYGEKSLRELCSAVDLSVSECETLASPEAWLVSARNWLVDWRMNRLLIGLMTGPWFIPWLLAWLIERIARFRNRAAILVVYLKKD